MKKIDKIKYASLAREAVAEGCVLLENKGEALPLKKGETISIFGRIGFHYYKSGLGSGGLVNTDPVIGILDALEAEDEITVNQDLKQIYEKWIKQNPFDEGQGWGKVPWSQKEMPLTDEIVQEAARNSEAAIIMIGRTAGEDQDNTASDGGYLLTELELDMLEKVCSKFERTIVLLNVGNIIDMKWIRQYNPSSVMYVWQGGQEGGNGVADVLMGRVNPCGKLTDTIAWDIEDYPSTENFGDSSCNFYKEDIYVGYRYFETFAKDKVLYPFGYGLSYTNFDIRYEVFQEKNEIIVQAVVKNIGSMPGKEVVQAYMKAPQGKLGKPAKTLVGFSKTRFLRPGDEETISIAISEYIYASYDDSGITGNKSCYILEEGCYELYVGTDVRSARSVYQWEKEYTVLERLEEACAPTVPFKRYHPEKTGEDIYCVTEENVPLRTIDLEKRKQEEDDFTFSYTGNKGISFGDVYEEKATLNDFVEQLSNEELIVMFRGEGMCSPKVTPGTASAFGGVTPSLKEYGIPVACCADGPSGIRMDCGTKAFSLPNGTLLGCTFNLELVENLYEMLGVELCANKIDTLLGPGLNIHRNPLNGRNFEYISEDPLLTGKMGVAQIVGIQKSKAAGTIKHYCANNQEKNRREVDAEISERALREIYLKGFEITVKEGKCRSIMTTYGPLNGIWTAGNFDLNTTILRKEWGFRGIVMTDWWAEANNEGKMSTKYNRAPMIDAQNDLYMVTDDSTDMEQDNAREALVLGSITRGELCRNACNILSFILQSPAMERMMHPELDTADEADEEQLMIENLKYYTLEEDRDYLDIEFENEVSKKNSSVLFGICTKRTGIYEIELQLKSDLDSLAQLPITIFFDSHIAAMVSIQGSNGKWIEENRELGFLFGKTHFVKLYYGADGLQIGRIRIRLKEQISLDHE